MVAPGRAIGHLLILRALDTRVPYRGVAFHRRTGEFDMYVCLWGQGLRIQRALLRFVAAVPRVWVARKQHGDDFYLDRAFADGNFAEWQVRVVAFGVRLSAFARRP